VRTGAPYLTVVPSLTGPPYPYLTEVPYRTGVLYLASGTPYLIRAGAP
jgi:hypothetical protein